MSTPFGSACYIKAQPSPSPFSLCDPSPLFRREIEIDEEIRKATLLVQSPCFAEYYINATPVTADRFLSPVSDYRKILWYNVYDVTALLRRGVNVLGVITGNGFFNEPFQSAWHFPEAPWRDAPQFLLALYVNGKEVAVSDNRWRCSTEHSHILFSHLRSGEYVDAGKQDSAWLSAGYDTSDWQIPILRSAPVTGELRLTPCQPVRECERIEPQSIRQTADGSYLVDFGMNLSGYMEITLTAKRGDEIVFHYAEEVDEDLRPRHNGMDRPCFYAESPFGVNRLIASGGVDTFKPLFSYHGFRYVLIEGLRKAPAASSVYAHFVHQDVARRSEFDSGNKVLNFIYRAGIRSTYSNMFWSLTDCPTREKLGWANDAQYSVEQTLINFDIVPLYTKWFEDLKSSMRPDGALPGIIPSPDWGFDWGPVCDFLLFEIPYRIYLYTGITNLLTEAIPYFERYARYLSAKLSDKEFSFILGDWLGYRNSKRVSLRFVQEFYLIRVLRLTAFANRLAGSDGSLWENACERETERFLSCYLDTSGRCLFDEQTPCAMLLETGLFRDRVALERQLVAAVERDGCTLTCGMVGVQYLYDALMHSGRADLALRMITESEPGYRTWYRHGASTLWERWDGECEGSHNHHMFAGVIAWFYKALLGIEPREDAPGFEEITLSPCFCSELGFVRGEIETVRGKICARWQYADGIFHYTVTLPDGIRATFRGKPLSTGLNEFWIPKSDQKENRYEDH